MTSRVGIQIHAEDNVVTVVDGASAGDVVQYMTPQGMRQVTALEAVPMAHKVAIEEIGPGEKVLKYNQAIGIASQAINKGGHVHAHNVQSAVQGEQDEN